MNPSVILMPSFPGFAPTIRIHIPGIHQGCAFVADQSLEATGENREQAKQLAIAVASAINIPFRDGDE